MPYSRSLPVLLRPVATAATFLLAYPILRSATLLQRVVGTSVLTVVQRILGLVLAALSIQTAVAGMTHLFGGRLG